MQKSSYLNARFIQIFLCQNENKCRFCFTEPRMFLLAIFELRSPVPLGIGQLPTFRMRSIVRYGKKEELVNLKSDILDLESKTRPRKMISHR